jgi:hypothetical protein
MSTSKKSEEREIEAVRDLLSADLARRLSALSAPLAKGEMPSEDDANAIERLSKLMTLLPLKKNRRSQQIDLVLLFAAVPVLLASAFIRLPSTAVDIEVRATGMTLALGGNHSDLLIPGESGEILALSQARISGADAVSPQSMGLASTVEIRQLVLDKQPPTIRKADLAVRLQEIAVPSDIPFKLGVSLAYAAQSRGLMLHMVGEKPARAQFGEVIPIESAENNNTQIRYAIRPVRVSGKDLEMELIPINNADALTVLRDVHVSQITFGDDGHSSILGGSAVVKGRSENKITIQPSDNLNIQSAKPMLVRELKFEKGELRVTLTTPNANTISVGDDPPRDLRPTLFEWIRFRWPTQLYGALSALAALWFAARTWWKSPE